MKKVKIYGSGCTRCEATSQMVRDTAVKLGLDVEIEKVTDPKSIAMAGVMSTPAIAIDDKLVHAGGIPDKARLEGWLAG